MSIPHQKIIVRVIWCLVIADAVRQGVSLPYSEFVAMASTPHQFNANMVIFGLFGPPLLMLGNVAMLKAFPKMAPFGTGAVTRWVDSRWGSGSMHAFLRALRPTALVALAAFVLGSLGMVSSKYANASQFAFEIASFFLAAGVGFGIARIIGLRLLPDQPWV
jgi:hypothetical protein